MRPTSSSPPTAILTPAPCVISIGSTGHRGSSWAARPGALCRPTASIARRWTATSSLRSTSTRTTPAGLVWACQAQGRVIYHPDEHWAAGISIENSDQFVDNEVTFRFAFNAQLGIQFDASTQNTVPKVFPDVIAKIAYDSNPGGQNFHVEAAGMMRNFESVGIASGMFSFHQTDATGFGVALNADLEPIMGWHLIGNTFWSNGGRRYIGGLGPDAVVIPTSSHFIQLKTAESMSAVLATELLATPNTVFGAYWSARSCFRYLLIAVDASRRKERRAIGALFLCPPALV
jgi:hypothetical protein